MLETSSWFAIETRPRCEKLVGNILENKGYELFLPMYKSRRRWSDRIKELDLPLFPGYLFCRWSPQQRTLPLLTTPWVRQIVGNRQDTGSHPRSGNRRSAGHPEVGPARAALAIPQSRAMHPDQLRPA